MGRKKKYSPGFTLIELLVIIALTGILAVVSLFGFDTMKKRGRDQQRKSDLAQIAVALSLYYTKHGHYPPADTQERGCDSSLGSNAPGGACSALSGTNWAADSDLQLLVTESLIKKLPVDPTNKVMGGNAYAYKYETYTKRYNGTECSSYDTTKQDYGCAYYLATKLERDGSIYCIKVGVTSTSCPASL